MLDARCSMLPEQPSSRAWIISFHYSEPAACLRLRRRPSLAEKASGTKPLLIQIHNNHAFDTTTCLSLLADRLIVFVALGLWVEPIRRAHPVRIPRANAGGQACSQECGQVGRQITRDSRDSRDPTGHEATSLPLLGLPTVWYRRLRTVGRGDPSRRSALGSHTQTRTDRIALRNAVK